MTTGDINNNIRALERDLRLIQYPDPLNVEKTSQGEPTVFLPILHYALTQYSPLVANFIREEGYHLLAKSDYRFVELSFNFMTNKFNKKPAISVNQFFTPGFAERKIILCSELITKVRSKHVALANQAKSQKSQAPRKTTTSVREPEIQDSKSQIPVKVRVERMQPILPPQPYINKENFHSNRAEEQIAALEEPKVRCTKKPAPSIDLRQENKNPMFEQLFQMFGQLNNALMSTTRMVSSLQEQHEALKQKHELEKQRLNNEIILLKNRVAFLENNHQPVMNPVQRQLEIQPQINSSLNEAPAVVSESQVSTAEFISSIKARFENTMSQLAVMENS